MDLNAKEIMISRLLTEDDRVFLEGILQEDTYHWDTPVEFFYEEGTVCLIFQDTDGVVLFARGKPLEQDNVRIIQLDLQFVDNSDAKRNMRIMLEGFPDLEKRASENGFHGFFFVSDVPLLRKFCCKRLGFTEFDENVLVKRLDNEGQIEVL